VLDAALSADCRVLGLGLGAVLVLGLGLGLVPGSVMTNDDPLTRSEA
jgi:hypothetical protein